MDAFSTSDRNNVVRSENILKLWSSLVAPTATFLLYENISDIFTDIIYDYLQSKNIQNSTTALISNLNQNSNLKLNKDLNGTTNLTENKVENKIKTEEKINIIPPSSAATSTTPPPSNPTSTSTSSQNPTQNLTQNTAQNTTQILTENATKNSKILTQNNLKKILKLKGVEWGILVRIILDSVVQSPWNVSPPTAESNKFENRNVSQYLG